MHSHKKFLVFSYINHTHYPHNWQKLAFFKCFLFINVPIHDKMIDYVLFSDLLSYSYRDDILEIKI